MNNKRSESGPLQILKNIWIENVPSYANRIYFSLGFFSMICFFLLIGTGILLVFFGPNWWFTNPFGEYVRSLHLWSVQAFVVVMMLHVLIVFLTGGYRAPRKLTWVLGALMLFLALMEAEFGYVLRNDFSAQWRSLQGADLYNGSGLGTLINNLNYAQIYGIHVIIIPIVFLGILFLHYALVRLRGIAAPYRKEVPYKMVKANHTLLFLRGLLLIVLICLMAKLFPSPMISPLTISQIAKEDPQLMATTLLHELDHTSDTATYFDTIDPYRFDTKKVYVEIPYGQSLALQQDSTNLFTQFISENDRVQASNVKAAADYFTNNGPLTTAPSVKNPVIPLISTLVLMAQTGLYESSLQKQITGGDTTTYVLRLLADTGALEASATKRGMTTPQYGMLREESGAIPPGAWWLAPLGLMDNTFLKQDDNQDRDGAEILGIVMIVFITFPYIPLLNQVPDKLGFYKFFWKK